MPFAKKVESDRDHSDRQREHIKKLMEENNKSAKRVFCVEPGLNLATTNKNPEGKAAFVPNIATADGHYQTAALETPGTLAQANVQQFLAHLLKKGWFEALQEMEVSCEGPHAIFTRQIRGNVKELLLSVRLLEVTANSTNLFRKPAFREGWELTHSKEQLINLVNEIFGAHIEVSTLATAKSLAALEENLFKALGYDMMHEFVRLTFNSHEAEERSESLREGIVAMAGVISENMPNRVAGVVIVENVVLTIFKRIEDHLGEKLHVVLGKKELKGKLTYVVLFNLPKLHSLGKVWIQYKRKRSNRHLAAER